jgi:hypothetical protein
MNIKKVAFAAAALSCLGLGALTIPAQADTIVKTKTIIVRPDGSVVKVKKIVRQDDFCKTVVRVVKTEGETVVRKSRVCQD